MTKRDFELLEQNGWIVECESPFNIRHVESGSQASDIAAEMILGVLQRENEGKLTKSQYQDKIRELTTFLVAVSPTPTYQRLEIIEILNLSIEHEYPS